MSNWKRMNSNIAFSQSGSPGGEGLVVGARSGLATFTEAEALRVLSGLTDPSRRAFFDHFMGYATHNAATMPQPYSSRVDDGANFTYGHSGAYDYATASVSNATGGLSSFNHGQHWQLDGETPLVFETRVRVDALENGEVQIGLISEDDDSVILTDSDTTTPTSDADFVLAFGYADDHGDNWNLYCISDDRDDEVFVSDVEYVVDEWYVLRIVVYNRDAHFYINGIHVHTFEAVVDADSGVYVAPEFAVVADDEEAVTLNVDYLSITT
jgi:hypothetical protein